MTSSDGTSAFTGYVGANDSLTRTVTLDPGEPAWSRIISGLHDFTISAWVNPTLRSA